MSRLSLNLACGDYEIVRALADGKVMAGGIDLDVLTERYSPGEGPSAARDSKI